jgi:hypothetical protein
MQKPDSTQKTMQGNYNNRLSERRDAKVPSRSRDAEMPSRSVLAYGSKAAPWATEEPLPYTSARKFSVSASNAAAYAHDQGRGASGFKQGGGQGAPDMTPPDKGYRFVDRSNMQPGSRSVAAFGARSAPFATEYDSGGGGALMSSAGPVPYSRKALMGGGLR